MTAIDEIRVGTPGDATLGLAMRSAARVVNDFAPRAGYSGWTREALEELVASLFAAKRGLLAAALASGVTSDDALGAFLLRATRNLLIDEARETDVGKMRRRLVTLLGRDPRFVFAKVPKHTWALVEFASVVWSDDLDVLRQAAARVRGVYVTKLNTAGPTPRKVADVLRAIAAAVLGEAAGAVPAQDLARVMLERLFPGAQAPVYLGEPGGEGQEFESLEPGPGFVIEVASAAESVFAALSGNERKLVPLLGATPAERVGALDGVGPSETEALVAAVRAKVAAAVLDDEDAEHVVLVLGNLCAGGS